MTDAPDLFTASALPDRSAFVRYAVEKFAAVTTWTDFWRLVDSIRDKRAKLKREENLAADREIGTAASAAFNRIPAIRSEKPE